MNEFPEWLRKLRERKRLKLYGLSERCKIKKIFFVLGVRGRYTYRYAVYAGATCPCRFISFLLISRWAGLRLRPDGDDMRAHVPRWRRGLQNRVWWVQFPTVRAIGVTSCLAAARSVSLRKWSFLCAVRKRQDEGIYLLAGTGLVKMNGCDRRTGAGLKSSVVGLGTTVLERNPRRGCGVVAVVLGQSRFVGQYGCVVAPDQLCKTTGNALADRLKGCVPNSLLT